MKIVSAIKILALGSLSAGVISFLSMAITARFIDPIYFGQYAVFASIATIVAVISTLRADILICQKRSKKRAGNLFLIAMFFVLIISILSFLLLISFGFYFFQPINDNYLIYSLLSLSIFSLGFFQSASSLSLHERNYKKIAKIRLIQAILGGLVQVVFAMLYSDSMMALVFGFLIGQGFGGVLLLPKGCFKLSKRRLLECTLIFVKNRKNLMLSTFSVFLLILSPMMPAIIISKFIGLHEAGIFYFAVQTTTIPFTFLRRIFSNVTLGEGQGLSSNSFFIFINRNTRRILYLLLFTIIAFVIYFTYSEVIFEYAFGVEWKLSGRLSAILVPMFFVDMLSYSCFQFLNLKNKGSWLLKLELFRFLSVVLGTLMFSMLGFSIISVVSWYSFSMLISYSIVCVMVFQYFASERRKEYVA
tara:strand:- start:1882 stop:3132 length:1251 start_codon:yes stop_codon:yes gene_type:complete